MLYNEIIEEVTRRVEKVKPISAEYPLSFPEKLAIWLEDFEHDILLSQGANETLSVEFLADAAFDKHLMKSLLLKLSTRAGGWISKEL